LVPIFGVLMFFYRFKQIFWLFRFSFLRLLFKDAGWPSYIAPPLMIIGHSKISIGNRVRIMPNARLECTGERSELFFGNNISVGPSLTIICGSDRRLEIKSNTTISANVFICDVEHDYRCIGQHIMEQPLIKKQTVIGEGSFIGYGAIIQAGTILGEQCVVGANSVVRGVFPDYCVIAGNPAKIIKQYNIESQIWERV
jgi:acetyltransferase-like isoleucine patch superfamily enzyme